MQKCKNAKMQKCKKNKKIVCDEMSDVKKKLKKEKK